MVYHLFYNITLIIIIIIIIIQTLFKNSHKITQVFIIKIMMIIIIYSFLVRIFA